VRLLQHIASEAGFETEFAYIDDIEFSTKDGISYENKNYELWFKLIPWEDIALEESDLAMLLTNIIKNQKAIIFNPAYTLLFQSKGLLKILWDLYPNHPLLLESSFEPLQGKKQVKKPVFGREGASVGWAVSQNVNINTNAIDPNIIVNRGPNPTLPLTVEIDIDEDPALTNRWLIYNEDTDDTLQESPSPLYKVRFIGSSGWAGHGDTRHVVESNASTKKNRRLEW